MSEEVIKKLQKENLMLKKKLNRAYKVIDLITECVKAADEVIVSEIIDGKQKLTKHYTINVEE